jgi:hypothetical protein
MFSRADGDTKVILAQQDHNLREPLRFLLWHIQAFRRSIPIAIEKQKEQIGNFEPDPDAD